MRCINSGRFKVTPLNRWGKEPEPIQVKIDPAIDMATPPKIQVDTISAEKFFSYAVELLKTNPPHITDQPIIAVIQRIGLGAGKDYDFNKLDPTVKKAFENLPQKTQELMRWKMPTVARLENGWSMNTDTMGVYGNYYLKRAIVAHKGSVPMFQKMRFIL